MVVNVHCHAVKHNVVECNLGEVELEPMLPTVLFIYAGNMQGGHPWNLLGQITHVLGFE